MEIALIGYGCFRLRSKQVTVVTDPFDRSVGLALGHLTADIVTLSSKQPPLSAGTALGGAAKVIDGPGEYEIANTLIVGVQTYRDAVKGRERGKNTAYAIELDGVVVAHLGAIGHVPNSEQAEALGNVDVLLLPVGGHGALDAAMAAEVVSVIEPSLVIPMMYAADRLALPADSLDRFLKEMGVSEATPQPKLTVTKSGLPDSVQVAVLEAKPA